MSDPRPSPPIRPTRPKRVKIDVACDACRVKKIKCDGVRPTCGNCAKKLALRDRCSYCHNGGGLASTKRSAPTDIQDNNTGRMVDQSYVRPRLGTYEDSSRQMNHVRDSRPDMGRLTGQSPASNTSPAGSYGANKSTGDYSAGSRPLVVASNTSPSVIDSMTAVVDEGTRTREYFGSSSAGSFTAQIKRAIDVRLGNPSTSQSAHVAAQRSAVAAPLMQGVVSDANRVLPTRRQADQLLSLYWTYVDPLYPFLERPKWEDAYRGIFDGTAIDLEEQTFLATLNIIFALSTQLLEAQTPEQRDDSSNVYFQRAQHLLPLNTWDPGSVELVQYLLLTSQYLQSTESPHQTWMTVSSAIRIAQGLGLHLCETSAEQPGQNEREILRRIWYGCVLMDRMVSVTHGRPSMIASQLATVVPLPTYSQNSANDQNGGRTDASFFVKSVELYEILHRAVTTLYDISGARSKNIMASSNETSGSEVDSIDLGTVMQLDSALVKWEKSLPERLKQASSGARDEITHRQAVILQIRLLHARSLLFRPILASFCLAQQTESVAEFDTLESRVLQQCAELCVSTAQKIISVLLDHQEDGTVGLLPAWWYRVYYVYTAATILIATKLCPEVFPGAGVSRAWSQAMSVLKGHEKFGQSVRRCVAALHFLAARIVQDTGGSETTRRGAGLASRQHTPPEQNEDDAYLPAFSEEFSFSVGDLGEIGLQDVDFDVNNLAWLNDMHGTWELLNHG